MSTTNQTQRRITKTKEVINKRHSSLMLDAYLFCNKNKTVHKSDIRAKCEEHEVDPFYVPSAMIELGILTTDSPQQRNTEYRWAVGIPTPQMIEDVIELSKKMRRESRADRNKRRVLIQAIHNGGGVEPEIPFESCADLTKEPQETIGIMWCLKFGDEKQYFSAFGFEVMRQIGRILATETVK